MNKKPNPMQNQLAMLVLTAVLIIGIAATALQASALPGQAAQPARAKNQGVQSPTPAAFGIIEYVVDLSASMMRPLPDGDRIWDKTQASIFTYEDYILSPNLAIGLRTFGYPDLRCDQQAEPSDAVVYPRLNTGPTIVNAMGQIVPNPSGESGRSAILAAIGKALEDVGSIGSAAGQNRSIIVFTDGKENCMLDAQERQAWMQSYVERTDALASTGVNVKTFVLIIVPEDQEICELFTGHENTITCIPVSAVEASNLPGIVEAIRFETVYEDTPTPTPSLEPSATFVPSLTPTATDYIFHEVPTGEALPTIDKTLLGQAATPVIQTPTETAGPDIKLVLLPVGLVTIIGVGLVVVLVMNLGGGRKKRR